VTRASGIESAREGDVTFLADGRFAERLARTRASVVLVPPDAEVPAGVTVIRVARPEWAFCDVVERLHPAEPWPPGVAELACVAESATLGEGVAVRPFAVVEEGASVGDRTLVGSGAFVGRRVTVGPDCVLSPGVVLCDGVRLGSRVIVGPNSVIGYDGFGFLPGKDSHRKIPQVGTVVVEDDVEIGACCTIDRARLDETRIGRGTKLDNLVHVAHNVRLGELCLVAAQAGFAGSASVGSRTMVGGQAGVSGHLTVGSGVQVSGKAGVTKSFPDNVRVSGFPAVPHEKWIEALAAAKRLPRLAAEIEELKAKLHELERRSKDARGRA
jgi:UDP-3-O-[3-hydroxymyristoyl] glucosamine N-acyltransferase